MVHCICAFRCGYVLQPECIRHDLFELDSRDAAATAGVEPLTLTLTVSSETNTKINYYLCCNVEPHMSKKHKFSHSLSNLP